MRKLFISSGSLAIGQGCGCWEPVARGCLGFSVVQWALGVGAGRTWDTSSGTSSGVLALRCVWCALPLPRSISWVCVWWDGGTCLSVASCSGGPLGPTSLPWPQSPWDLCAWFGVPRLGSVIWARLQGGISLLSLDG